jgi:hypothetical protein
VKKRIVVSLRTTELLLLRTILDFVEAGEVSGGSLDAETPPDKK